MIAGNPNARAVHFFIDSDVVPLELIGDGLLPADLDGKRRPKDGAPAPIVGTQDDGAGYGGTFDALNIWELSVKWKANSGGFAHSASAASRGPVRLDLSRARRLRATACPSPGSTIRRSTSTSFPTGSGPHSGSPTAISGLTRRS